MNRIRPHRDYSVLRAPQYLNPALPTVDSRVRRTTIGIALTMRNAIVVWLQCLLVVVVRHTGTSVPDRVDILVHQNHRHLAMGELSQL